MKEFLNSNNVFDEILSKADVVEVVGKYVQLKKQGKDYTGLCPFHDDHKLGNFHVSREKRVFNCFACNTKGNAISFVKKMDHCSNLEAAKKVCEICGIDDSKLKEFSKNGPKVDPKLEKTLEILKDISSFYMLSLFQSDEGKEALAYLHNRGLNDDVIRKFNIGYSLKNGKILVKYLTEEKGYSLKEIEETGIISLSNSVIADKNFGRISFAITNSNGNICGFSCRNFKESNPVAKYVNTSSTIAFNKSTLLYNYDNALLESNKKDINYVYILEGFMDVIACDRVGINSAIGLMGVELTSEHIKMLKRLNCEVRLCLDLDNAGQNGMYKIFKTLESNNIPFVCVNNDVDFTFKDSDEILKNLGEEKLKSFLLNLIDKPRWLINYFKKNLDLSLIQNKEKMINYFIPMLKNNNSLIEVDNYIKLLEKETGISYQIIKEMVDKNKVEKKDDFIINEPLIDNKPIINKEKSNDKKLLNAEKLMIKFIFEDENALSLFKDKVDTFYNPLYNEIYELIILYMKNNDLLYPLSKDVIKEIISKSEFKNQDDLKNEVDLIFSYKNYDSYSKNVGDELIEKINLEKEKLNLINQNKDLKKNISNDDNLILSIMSNSKNKFLIKEEQKRRKLWEEKKK